MMVQFPEYGRVKMSRTLTKIYQIVNQKPMKALMLFAILSRAFVFTVAVATNSIFGPRSCADCWDIGFPFLNLFSRWDSGYYADIALHGYSRLVTANWGFLPGYPILMGILGRLLAVITQIQLLLAVHLAGFVISNLAFFGSVYYFYKLSMKVLQNSKLAYGSALFLSFYPAGVFLSATYSDSLFLLLTISSVYYWQLGRFGRSSALGFYAALTRPVGILLAVPYLYLLLTDQSRRRKAVAYLPIISAFLGYLSFIAYSQFMTGTPFANLAAERMFWEVTLDLNSKLAMAGGEILGNPIIVPYLVLSIGAIIVSTFSAGGKAERAIDLYAIFLFIAYLYGPVNSFPRYSITLLPAYWSFARWSQGPLTRVLMYCVFLILLTVGTGLFVNWYNFY